MDNFNLHLSVKPLALHNQSKLLSRLTNRPMLNPALHSTYNERIALKKTFFILIIVGAWYVNKNGWPEFLQRSSSPVISNTSTPAKSPAAPLTFAPHSTATAPSSAFRCDGRQHCSQMRSYEEAVYFLRNCPNTKMDGDGDGIPCERQFGR